MVDPRALSSFCVLRTVGAKPEADHRIIDLTAIVAYGKKEVSRHRVGGEKENSQGDQTQQRKYDHIPMRQSCFRHVFWSDRVRLAHEFDFSPACIDTAKRPVFCAMVLSFDMLIAQNPMEMGALLETRGCEQEYGQMPDARAAPI